MNSNLKQILIIVTIIIFPQILFAQDNAENLKNSKDAHREIVYEYNRSPTPEASADWRKSYFKITVSPQKFLYPILKHRLNVPLVHTEFDNAYPFYTEATLELNKVRHEQLKNCWQSKEYKSLDKQADAAKISQLESSYFPVFVHPPKVGGNNNSITPEKEKEIYNRLSKVYQLLEKGSRSRFFKWDENNELRGVATQMAFISDIRKLGIYLANKADWEIRNKNYDDAVKTIKVGLTMSNHVINSPISLFVSALAGNGINNVMHRQLLHLISQPDAPNLYPALTQLRPNFNALPNIANSEKFGFVFYKPIKKELWANIDKASESECKDIVEQIAELFYAVSFLDYETSEVFKNRDYSRTKVFSAFCIFSYMPAKQRLRERGFSEEKINSLSLCQVIAPYAIEKINDAYDHLCVASTFKPFEVRDTVYWAERDLYKKLFSDANSTVDYLLMLITPGVSAGQDSIFRTDQLFDVLKITEAIRHYIAVHDGKLPESLDVIKETPIPKTDLFSGKPYIYKVEGKKITIEYATWNTEKPDSRLEIVVE
ncbi:MAG: hypothetical protein LBB88_07900 [Planctomycetaceae bacterium]|jgi:hypothetical protein|nr:hypothetical protein [Planctomycetaceae bacterium]